MSHTVKTTGTKRVLTAVTMAILWLAGATTGWAAEPPTGLTYTNSLGMALVRFNAGAFVMGEGTSSSIPETAAGPLDWDEQPAHPVVLTTPFYVLTVRVPKAQFDQAGLGAAPMPPTVCVNRRRSKAKRRSGSCWTRRRRPTSRTVRSRSTRWP